VRCARSLIKDKPISAKNPPDKSLSYANFFVNHETNATKINAVRVKETKRQK
jgi:hypothetical protein